jgi:hypothetical protein
MADRVQDRVGQVLQRLDWLRERAEELVSRAERIANPGHQEPAAKPTHAEPSADADQDR